MAKQTEGSLRPELALLVGWHTIVHPKGKRLLKEVSSRTFAPSIDSSSGKATHSAEYN